VFTEMSKKLFSTVCYIKQDHLIGIPRNTFYLDWQKLLKCTWQNLLSPIYTLCLPSLCFKTA